MQPDRNKVSFTAPVMIQNGHNEAINARINREAASLPPLASTWIRSPEMNEHLLHLQKVRWSSPIGPMGSWPLELSFLVQVIMLDTEPRLVLLGPDDQMLYNPAYGALIGDAHPSFLGMGVGEAWADERTFIDESRRVVDATNQPSVMHDISFYFRKNGFLEEKILSWRVSKIMGLNSGYYAAITDHTELRVAESRRLTLRTLCEDWGEARNLPSLWKLVTQSISDRPYDFPFALLYTSCDNSGGPYNGHDVDDTSKLRLRGSIGEFATAPLDLLDLETSRSDLTNALKEAIVSDRLSLIKPDTGSVPRDWYQASCSRGHGDPCRSAVILPIRSTRFREICGILLLGLSTRKQYDDHYHAWLVGLTTLLNEKIASVIAYEEETKVKVEEKQRAQVKQTLLAQELAVREREAWLATGKVQRMIKTMDMVDVGLWECSLEGELIQANEAWFRQCGHSRDPEKVKAFSWIDCVHPDLRDRALSAWHSLQQLEPISCELRWQRPDQDPSSDEGWFLAVCVPVVDEKGVLAYISGCTTNIDAQKRSEKDKTTRIEALERARASEKQFLRFTEIAPVGILIVDLPDFKVCNYAGGNAICTLSRH